MSNIIPMVSSSPPPLDDTGGYDDWGDDDDFGGFMGAEQTSNTWIKKDAKALDIANANIDNLDNNFPNEMKIDNCSDKISSLSLGLDKPLNDGISKQSLDCKTDCDTNESKISDSLSGNSTGDSGLFDVSPTPVSEDTKSDTSLTPISEDTHTDNSGPSMEAFQNSPDDIPATTIVNSGTIYGNIIQDTVNGEDMIPCVETCNVLNSEQSCIDTIRESNEIIHSDSCISNNFSISETEQLPSQINHENCDDLTSSHTDEVQQNVEHSIIEHSVEEEIQTNTNVFDNSITSEITTTHVINKQSMENPPEQNSSGKMDTDIGNLSCDNSTNDGNKDSNQESKSFPKNESNLYLRKFSETEDDESVNAKPIDKDNDLQFTDSGAKGTNEIQQGIVDANITDHETENKTDHNLNSQHNDKNINGENDDEFADFSETPEQTGNEKDSSETVQSSSNETAEDDEFADFSSALISDGIDSLKQNAIEKDSLETVKSSFNETTQDDNFADFGSSPINDGIDSPEQDVIEKDSTETAKSSSNDTSEDDEFADFSSAPTDHNDKAPEHPVTEDNCSETTLSISKDNDNSTLDSSPNNTNEETEEFGNFSSQGNFEKEEDSDDFADFSTATVNDDDFGNFDTVSVNSGEDGFADFSSAPMKEDNFSRNSADNVTHNSSWASFEKTDKEDSKISKTNMPPKQTNFCNMILGCFNDTNQLSQDTEDIDLTLEDKDNHLWIKIQEIDNTGLMKWSQCSSNRNLFISLKIDTKNILLGHKKPAVPIYAAHLTLLEPTKGAPNLLQPEVTTLVDTNKQEEVKDLPPVQFDWTSSGLKNPLEENNKLQNLDFLTVDESELIAKTKVFDADLIHGQKPAMQPLQNILANLKATKKTRLEDLSNEAGRVISHLPNLSFMKSKVLMFPLKDNNL